MKIKDAQSLPMSFLMLIIVSFVIKLIPESLFASLVSYTGNNIEALIMATTKNSSAHSFKIRLTAREDWQKMLSLISIYSSLCLQQIPLSASL